LLSRIDLKGEALNLDYTFGCGQIFQWSKVDGWWLGAVDRHATLLKVDDGSLLFKSGYGLKEEALREFLRLDSGHPEALGRSGLDDFSLSLLKDYEGLRILRQDPWLCLVSYMVSASLSIGAIDKILGRMASRSEDLRVGRHSVKAFPRPADFVGMGRPQKGYLGKKWEYLRAAAKSCRAGALDFESLKRASYEQAWESLVTSKETHLLGVGPKVADCVLLFSLEKPEAFPTDRWIMRGLSRHYGWLLPQRVAAKIGKGEESLSHKEYSEVSSNVRSYFGDIGGLVQECLFLHMRTAGPRRTSA
jgi:N-glycosylase/DNA lyase